MNIFLSPHNDDETLFGAFTILKHKPLVIVVFEARGGAEVAFNRTMETSRALSILGVEDWLQWRIQQEPPDTRECSAEKHRELEAAFRDLDEQKKPEIVWAPAIGPCGNAEHVAVGRTALAVFGKRVQAYHTYHAGKKVIQQNRPVPYEPEWVGRKHAALACYRSQFETAGRHFMEDLWEWYYA